ncbi:FecR family protein [Hyphomonas sp.]|uniref:FecR family protein n=1 Tax=Hyphomonas sp. TaxID=87 RepID=UPI0025BB2180|nr:FecR family protein [Hyphomonas sp.]
MPHYLKFVLACMGLAMTWLAQPALAKGEEWQLSSPSGIVRVMLPGEAITKGKDGMSLPKGTIVTTGRESSVILSNGAQKIDLAADTRLTVAESSGGMTTIRQDAGAAFYQVDSKAMPHFRVDTALLAAVVKGTGFTVSAGPDADVVHVAHGLVEVSLQQGGGAVDVAPGETARVKRANPFEIGVAGSKEATAAPAALSIPPIDYAEASGNLLQSESGPGDAAKGKPDGLPEAAGTEQGNQGEQRQNFNAAAVSAAQGGAGNANGAGNAEGAANGDGSGNGNGGGAPSGEGAGNGNGGGAPSGDGAGNGNGNGNGGGAPSGEGAGNGNGGGAPSGDGAGNGNGNGNGNGGGAPSGEGAGNGNGGGAPSGEGAGNGNGAAGGNGAGDGGGNSGGGNPEPPRGPRR